MNSELIEKIKKLPDKANVFAMARGHDFEQSYPLGTADKLKQLAAEYERLVEQTRWIPCSERLPEDDGQYEVTTEIMVSTDFFTDGAFDDPCVIAWRELSEPYDPQAR